MTEINNNYNIILAEGNTEEIKGLFADNKVNVDDFPLVFTSNNKNLSEDEELELFNYFLNTYEERFNNLNLHLYNDFLFTSLCKYNKLKLVKFLLEQLPEEKYGKFDIHANNEYAICYSCAKGHIDLLKYLLDLPKEKYGEFNQEILETTAFQWAFTNQRKEIVELLINGYNGYKINMTQEYHTLLKHYFGPEYKNIFGIRM